VTALGARTRERARVRFFLCIAVATIEQGPKPWILSFLDSGVRRNDEQEQTGRSFAGGRADRQPVETASSLKYFDIIFSILHIHALLCAESLLWLQQQLDSPSNKEKP